MENETNGEKYTFNNDNTYKLEVYDSGHYNEFENGTYLYTESGRKLTLEVLNRDTGLNGTLVDISDQNRVQTHNLELNNDKTILVMGADALLGGNTSTLIGEWDGFFQEKKDGVNALMHKVKWIFTATTATEKLFIQSGTEDPIVDSTKTGDVSYNIANSQFTISNSGDTYFDGVYNFVVVGDAISIIQDPDNAEFYEKQ